MLQSGLRRFKIKKTCNLLSFNHSRTIPESIKLGWAGQLVDIDDQEKDMIIQSKKSLIIMDGKDWSKTNIVILMSI